MDTRTGDLYPTKQAALDAGVPEEYVVEITGPKKAVGRLKRLARNANARRIARRRQQKMSRKDNR